MIINYGLKEDGVTFDFWQVYPIVDDLPKLEIADPRIIKVGVTKLINGKIVQPEETTPTEDEIIERNKKVFRGYRDMIFRRGFDVWEKNVLRGREQDSEEVVSWYNQMLNYTTLIAKNTTVNDYPKTPDAIKKYIGG